MINGSFFIDPISATWLHNTQVQLLVSNTIFGPLDVVTLTWTLDELNIVMPATCFNGEPIIRNGTRKFTTGNYLGKVKCVWPNGQTRTFQQIYITNPI